MPCPNNDATCIAGRGRSQSAKATHSREVPHPPAHTGRKPALARIRATDSRWSPWISIHPSFIVPPAPQAFCISLASLSISAGPMPVKPVTTVTVLPPRCAVWRTISTRPRFFFGAAGATSRGVISGADGRSMFLRAAKGLVHVIDSPPVGMRVFFFIPSMSKWG
jgi:hypothetical protein